MNCVPSCSSIVVDRADVRMIQRGSRARFALKALERLWVAGCFRRQKFQRNVPA